jgi:hypothetical protein
MNSANAGRNEKEAKAPFYSDDVTGTPCGDAMWSG